MAGRGAAGGPNVLYLDLPGTSGHYVSTPDSAAASVTSDIDIRVKAAMTDWTPDAESKGLVAKWGAAGSRSYRLFLTATGTLTLQGSTAGTTVAGATSSAATGVTNGASKWLRATWVNSTNIVQFFTSNDGSSWSQLGTDQTLSLTGIHDNASPVVLGVNTSDDTTANVLDGDLYYAEIRNGVGGTVALSFDATTVTKLGVRDPTTLAAGGTAGGTWTVNGTSWDWVTL